MANERRQRLEPFARRADLPVRVASRGPRVQKARLGSELAARDLLQLELAQRGRKFSPTGDAALFDAERVCQFRLRTVVSNRFVRRHIPC